MRVLYRLMIIEQACVCYAYITIHASRETCRRDGCFQGDRCLSAGKSDRKWATDCLPNRKIKSLEKEKLKLPSICLIFVVNDGNQSRLLITVTCPKCSLEYVGGKGFGLRHIHKHGLPLINPIVVHDPNEDKKGGSYHPVHKTPMQVWCLAEGQRHDFSSSGYYIRSLCCFLCICILLHIYVLSSTLVLLWCHRPGSSGYKFRRSLGFDV